MTVEWTDAEREAAALALHSDSCVGNDCGVDVDDLPDSAEWRQANAVLEALGPLVAKRLRYLWKVEADAAQAWKFVDEHLASIERLAAERDALEGVADSLAYAIAPVEVIGEHSSSNNPWANALEIAREKR